METITIYHNPRCSKSRAALALIDERKVPVNIVEYLKQPPTRDELQALRRKLGLAPAAWVRKGEEAYRQANLSAHSSEEQILDAMAKHPILIERPIAVRGNKAVIARPPEKVLELL